MDEIRTQLSSGEKFVSVMQCFPYVRQQHDEVSYASLIEWMPNILLIV